MRHQIGPKFPDVFDGNLRRTVGPRELARLGWTRVDPRPWSKCEARWSHVAGWRLEHCGHPTALWPWQLFAPTGELVLTGAALSGNPRHGRAWPNLATATAYVREVTS